MTRDSCLHKQAIAEAVTFGFHLLALRSCIFWLCLLLRVFLWGLQFFGLFPWPLTIHMLFFPLWDCSSLRESSGPYTSFLPHIGCLVRCKWTTSWTKCLRNPIFICHARNNQWWKSLGISRYFESWNHSSLMIFSAHACDLGCGQRISLPRMCVFWVHGCIIPGGEVIECGYLPYW